MERTLLLVREASTEKEFRKIVKALEIIGLDYNVIHALGTGKNMLGSPLTWCVWRIEVWSDGPLEELPEAAVPD